MQFFKKISLRGVIEVCVLLFVFSLVGNHIYTLQKENMALKEAAIAADYKMLNIVRTGEISKSMVNLELLKCRGVKQSTLDSLAIQLFYTNTKLIKRDSSFIVERYRELHAE
jgi:hypothetical protein